MRYRVRNQHGELGFENYFELERAYTQGLVEADDEVLEEGATQWRKAGTLPLLVKARREKRGTPLGDQVLNVLVAVALAGATLYLVLTGKWLWALLLALVCSAVLFRVTYKAFQTRR